MTVPAGPHYQHGSDGEERRAPHVALLDTRGQQSDLLQDGPGRRKRAQPLLRERVELDPPLRCQHGDGHVDDEPGDGGAAERAAGCRQVPAPHVRDEQQRQQQSGEQLRRGAQAHGGSSADGAAAPVEVDAEDHEEHRQQVPVVPDVQDQRGRERPPPQSALGHAHAVQHHQESQRERTVDQRDNDEKRERGAVGADQRAAGGTLDPDLRTGEHRVLERGIDVRDAAARNVAGRPERDDVGVAPRRVLLAVAPATVDVAVRLERPASEQHDHRDGQHRAGHGGAPR